MRYGPEQSEKTKNRVVKIAAAQMRKHGPDKVGVAAVMSRAGLTHGGFYAHFKSKDDLIAAAIDRMFEEARERFGAAIDGMTKPEALRTYINLYVSRSHRDHPVVTGPLVLGAQPAQGAVRHESQADGDQLLSASVVADCN